LIKQPAEDKILTMKKNIIPLFVFIVLTLNISCDKTSDAKGNPGISGRGGSLARFTIAGNYLYMVDKSQLKVFNISDPSSPELRSTTNVGFEIETIFPFKDKLFVGSTSVVHIFSIENPELPKKLSTAISPQVMRRCDPVVARDSVAYATLRTNGMCGGISSMLVVYDIRDVLNPVQVNQLPVAEPYGLGYADNALYVCDKSSLLVFDIADAYHPAWTKQLTDGDYFDVIPQGNTLVCWIKNGVALYDITNRLDPQLITSIN
jgi:hypothetical protein